LIFIKIKTKISNLLKECKGFRVDDKGIKVINDLVACEVSYKFYVNNLFMTDIVLSPSHLEEFAIGYLFSEGFLMPKDISSVHIENDVIKVLATCKIQRPKTNFDLITSNIRLSQSSIISYAKKLYHLAENWKKTGGLHIALLFDAKGKLIKSSEDISRYNTVDKVVGYACLKGIDLTKTILVISGRISKGIVIKAYRSRIPILISKSASTDAAIDFAKKIGITLIGFVKEDRFTVYTYKQRVLD